MELKLTAYNTTTIFTSRDIRDAATDPPLIYEVYTNRPAGFSEAIQQFYQTQTVENALKVIGLALVSVSVYGVEDSRQPIGSAEQARELMEAIERMAPGQGEGYVIQLARGIFGQQIDREEQRLKNSAAPSPLSGGGANGVPLTTAAESGET